MGVTAKVDNVGTPFVFCFQTDKNNYVYDVNTNRVFQVDNLLYSIIENYHPDCRDSLIEKYRGIFPKQEILNSCNEIENARINGIFSSRRPAKMSFGDSLEKLMRNKTCEQIILNVTEDCNLRCSYCVFSGHYEGHRGYSRKYMSEEIALKSIDYFLKNDTEKVNVAFYGGEPLLAFPLIKMVVSYVKSRSDKQVGFSMTSNGTLLGNDGVIQFLIENNFVLTVSLDGPGEVHDRYRKQIDGRGTYNLVTENLEKIKSMDEKYYRTKVIFSVVNAPPYRLDTTLNYFSQNTLINKNSITSSFLSRSRNSFTGSVEMDERGIREGNFNLIYDVYRERMLSKELIPPYIQSMVERHILQFYQRNKSELNNIPANGCCVPGMRRQFVDMDGSIYPCEKMGCSYPLGDIHNGLDFSKIKRLVEMYVDLSSQCLDCWACRLCSICYATCLNTGVLCGDRKEVECKAVRKRIEDIMRLYYSLVEIDSSMFDYMESK